MAGNESFASVDFIWDTTAGGASSTHSATVQLSYAPLGRWTTLTRRFSFYRVTDTHPANGTLLARILT